MAQGEFLRFADIQECCLCRDGQLFNRNRRDTWQLGEHGPISVGNTSVGRFDEGHVERSSRNSACQSIDKRRPVCVQKWAIESLESNGCAGSTAHPLAAWPFKMAREDCHPVRKAQQARHTVILSSCVSSAEVGPTNIAHEQ